MYWEQFKKLGQFGSYFTAFGNFAHMAVNWILIKQCDFCYHACIAGYGFGDQQICQHKYTVCSNPDILIRFTNLFEEPNQAEIRSQFKDMTSAKSSYIYCITTVDILFTSQIYCSVLDCVTARPCPLYSINSGQLIILRILKCTVCGRNLLLGS